MFEVPEFSDLQKRAIYIALASSIAIGSLFVTLSQGKASTPKAATSIAPITSRPTFAMNPTIAPVIVVDVAGKVLHPGVYKLPQGSRAIDAITAAGNALKGISLSDINLAAILSDGEQILVGAPQVVPQVVHGGTTSSRNKSSTAIVHINTASANQLQVLKGIGSVTAEKVVAYRKAHGNFSTVDDFKKAAGMGATKFNLIKSQLRL